jgi:hypothetical protein
MSLPKAKTTNNTSIALFVSLITIVSLKGFFRQDDVCTEHYLCTNIASVAYCLFDGFVSVAVSMATLNLTLDYLETCSKGKLVMRLMY